MICTRAPHSLFPVTAQNRNTGMTDLKKIKAFVFDIDGVFTDGGIYAIDGDLLRKYEAKDCMATRIAYMNGFKTGIITGGISDVIAQRMVRCGFDRSDIYLGVRKKIEAFDDFCQRHVLKPEEVMYCGDDLPDIPVLNACGLGACPADAVQEVKEAADFVSEFQGGRFFVRNTVEMVMKAQDKWYLDDNEYKKIF